MEKISAVIITFNEERNIARCLKSLQEIADEIIVLDSFSNDRTEEICRSFDKVKFFTNTFEEYGKQKNLAVSKATYSLVLSLDADEAVSEPLASSILKIKEKREFDGYYCKRMTNYCGKWIRHGGWYPDAQLRLWDIRKGKWDDSSIHEKVILPDSCKTAFLQGDLLHYSYYSITQHINQVNKYTDLNSELAFARGKKSNLLQIISRQAWKFSLDFIFKGGFLDGYYGFIIAAISSFATFLKYVKLRELGLSRIHNSDKS